MDSKFETAITNLAANMNLNDEQKRAFLTLTKNKRTKANKRWACWVGLFVLIVLVSVIIILFLGHTKASFKVVGSGLGVAGGLMAFLKEKETISNEEMKKVTGKNLSKVDLDFLNDCLATSSISSSSWIKLVSSIISFVGVVIITWGG